MFKTITILLLACTDCGLTKITRPFDNQYIYCGDMADAIRLEISTYNNEVNGWYTNNGMLLVGFQCH
jgi:hypothetical protein